MKIKLFALSASLLTFLFTWPAVAGVYQWKDEKGKTHFSDERPKHIQNVHPVETEIKNRIPAVKARPITTARRSGPQAVIVEDNTKPGRGCTTASNAVLDRSEMSDALQEKRWKECRGMK